MVFISHRQADSTLSMQIRDYLARWGVRSYLDVVDQRIRSPKGLTEHIIEQLRGCSHIIAVFSENTKGSYWVPFELGAAYERDLNIATYVFHPRVGNRLELPEYLQAFPVMDNIIHLDLFAKKYKNSDLVSRNGILLEKSRSEKMASEARRSADVFIDEMKVILGQS